MPTVGGLNTRTVVMRLLILSLLIYAGFTCLYSPGVQEEGSGVSRHNPAGPPKPKLPVGSADSGPAGSAGKKDFLAESQGTIPQDTNETPSSSTETDVQRGVNPVKVNEPDKLQPATAVVASSVAPASVSKLMVHLTRSLEAIEKIPAYTAILEQRVQKRGRVLDTDFIDLKLRRSPFSVYLKWHDDAQEVVYVEGLNDGRLLAHPTKGFASLRPIWRLRPNSSQAMKESRYPLTEVGIEKLTRMALEFYRTETTTQTDIVCVETPVLAEGRPAIAFQVFFSNEQISPQYATSCLTFDNESGLLVSLETHGWDVDGKPGLLLELYRYHRITPNPELADEDFSEMNPAYGFRN